MELWASGAVVRVRSLHIFACGCGSRLSPERFRACWKVLNFFCLRKAFTETPRCGKMHASLPFGQAPDGMGLDITFCSLPHPLQFVSAVPAGACFLVKIPDEGQPPKPVELGPNMEFVSWSFC